MSDIIVKMITAQPIKVKLITQTIQVKMTNYGIGDMLKSVYDKDGDGIVDTCNEVNGGIWE